MGKYVLITGGELQNKGAQAMTFITVDEIKKRYPDKEVILLSDIDNKRPAEVKDNYRFTIRPFPKKLTVLQSKLASLVYKSIKKNTSFNKFCDILSQSDALIDVSGYTYGSNWGTRHSFYFLLRIKMANAWKIPVYIMPQSFGPFDFKGKHAPFVRFLSKYELKKAKVIMAREEEGKKGLEDNFRLKNVVLTPDLVLQSKGIDLNNIYKNIPSLYDCDVPKGSVAVIPNSKNIKYSNEDTAYGMYKLLIDRLLKNQKNVFLIYHSSEDLEVCKKLKEKYYNSNSNVVCIENELSCIEFERLVEKFDFVAASRYHSIVHSYKMSIPAIILGWSVKYAELSEKFDQGRFCFDIKNRNAEENVLEQIDYMCENYRVESEKIGKSLDKIQSGSVYDYVKLNGSDC